MSNNNYVEMWTPEIGYETIIGDYKYTVIENDDELHIYHLQVETVNKTKSAYSSIQESLFFNGQEFTVVSLEICFKDCISLTTAPSIPAATLNLDNCFNNCPNLEGNIIIFAWSNDITHNNTFDGTQKNIYIVRNSSDISDASVLANGYNNVHFEANDNSVPNVFFTYERGSYSESDPVWTVDDTGDDVRLQGQVILSTDKLPIGWNNSLKPQSLDPLKVSGIEVFWNNSKITTESTKTHIIISSDNTFEIFIESQETAGTVKVQATDAHNHNSSYSDYVTQAFILLDFMPGGQGMAVGKAGYRNGLDISIPTAIGEGLELPQKQVYKKTTDSTIDSTKTYYIWDEVSEQYVEVAEPNVEQIDSYYEYVWTIDLNNYQLVVGKYNKPNEDAVFIVGNGNIDEFGNITQSNLMEVSSDALAFNNKYSEEIFYIGNLDDSTYANKLNWVKYNGESPFTFLLPWDCNNITSLLAYSNTYVYDPYINYTNNYSVLGREITINEATCNRMIERNVAFISISYSAQGKFPYYTFGSDGIGAIGKYSFRVGENNVASGNTSFASGDSTIASGSNSHSEGYLTEASNTNTHAEGYRTTASGSNAHAEGYYTTASGNHTHAEGYYTTASNIYAHAEGCETVSSNSASHAEGFHTTASGGGAHAEGNYTVADGHHSHAQNDHTIASSNDQTALGKYNIEDANDTYAFIIGNGIDNNNRSNALTVDWDGRVQCKSIISVDKTIDLSQTNNGISATTYINSLAARDSANRLITCQEGAVDPNGNVRSYWVLRNYDTSGTQVASKGITMTMNKSGTLTYSISDYANFRSALGLAAVAASGSYTDLSDKPTIATITNSAIKKVTRISVAESTSSAYTTSNGEKTIIFAIGAGQFYLFLGNTTSAGTCTSYKIGGNDTDVTIANGTNKFTLKNNSSAQVVFLLLAI